MNKIICATLSGVLEKALLKLKDSGKISFETLSQIRVEPTKDPKFGDVSTNVAMAMAAQANLPAPRLGALLVEVLKEASFNGVVESVEVAGPGFINFRLGRDPWIEVLAEILKSGAGYGKSSLGQGKKILIEFVSANPTGPLTLAHGRQAAVGDSLARIMKTSGFQVHKEYYLNDRGRQMSVLGRSVYLRYQECFGKKITFPEDFYQGDYILDLAKEVVEKEADRFLKEDEKDAVEFFSKYAGDRIMEDIRKDLSDFDVEFDHYFSERAFVATGRVEACLNELKKKGYTYEQEGALWLRSTPFGDDKDRVLIKSSGEMTYISPDAAYHEDKLRRGYDEVVDIWGPDHHGYIPRLKAAVAALGQNPERLKVIILQLATLFEGGQKLSMSTRRGEYVTLRQIMDEVGKDVGRYFFLMRKTDSHLDFDLELAKKESLENPVYYIQYAHARISSIFEKYMRESGSHEEIGLNSLSCLKTLEKEEVELIKRLGLFQEVLEGCCHSLDPYPLTDYLLKVAQSFHQFYTQHRVISESQEKTQGRLALVKAVKIVLRNGLGLLGVNAPEAM
ncbi:MAG: arginine--tRNA ligase [Chlamydiae bacterium]|nr:arginine--tRNA ligase [Chlamydiota bacterium]MBI3266715.1 arginine--tRNA ligase [Chlamydiota bacterium]